MNALADESQSLKIHLKINLKFNEKVIFSKEIRKKSY